MTNQVVPHVRTVTVNKTASKRFISDAMMSRLQHLQGPRLELQGHHESCQPLKNPDLCVPVLEQRSVRQSPHHLGHCWPPSIAVAQLKTWLYQLQRGQGPCQWQAGLMQIHLSPQRPTRRVERSPLAY